MHRDEENSNRYATRFFLKKAMGATVALLHHSCIAETIASTKLATPHSTACPIQMIKHFIKDLAMARDYLRDELDWPVKIKDLEVDPKRYKRRDFLLTQTHLGPIVEIRLSDGQVLYRLNHQRQHWEPPDWGQELRESSRWT